MISVIIVDDEKMALQQLNYILGQYQDLKILAEFTDSLEALEEIKMSKPDVVFLDIDMPEINGFMIAEEILKISTKTFIVFVTGFDEYAIKAFEINAIDYILKPVSRTRIDKTIKRIINNLNHNKKQNLAQILNIKNNEFISQKITKILVWEQDFIKVISPSDVIFFTILDRDVKVITKDGEFKARRTLNYWEKWLDHLNFYRCHRSYLINLDKVEKILPMFQNSYYVKMLDCPDEIPISKESYSNLKQIIG